MERGTLTNTSIPQGGLSLSFVSACIHSTVVTILTAFSHECSSVRQEESLSYYADIQYYILIQSVMKQLFIDFRKIVAKDVTDFSTITHAIFDWSSLKKLLRILKKRNSDIYWVNLPKDLDYYSLLEFWLDNCYPGNFSGYSIELDSPIMEGRFISGPSGGYALVGSSPISDQEETLATYYLKA